MGLFLKSKGKTLLFTPFYLCGVNTASDFCSTIFPQRLLPLIILFSDPLLVFPPPDYAMPVLALLGQLHPSPRLMALGFPGSPLPQHPANCGGDWMLTGFIVFTLLFFFFSAFFVFLKATPLPQSKTPDASTRYLQNIPWNYPHTSLLAASPFIQPPSLFPSAKVIFLLT